MVTVAEKQNKKIAIKKIEHHLRHYNQYRAGVKNLTMQIEFILPSVTASYEDREGTNGTFNITSKVENAVIDRIESKRALDLNEKIEFYKMIIKSIDHAYEELNDVEQTFIRERYYNQKSILQAAEACGYGEKRMFDIRNKLLDKLLISLSGILEI